MITNRYESYEAPGGLDRNELFEKFAPMVRRVAGHLHSRLTSNIELDDLVQNGMMGLLDAMEKFSGSSLIAFEVYAYQRIKGAIMDGLRQDDVAPKALRARMRQVEVAIRHLEQSLGRAPSDAEIAGEMNISLADYHELTADAHSHSFLYVEDLAPDEGSDFLDRYLGTDAKDPSALFENKQFFRDLCDAIEKLPEREQLVLDLYYDKELSFKEIGKILDVTLARVCQIHTQSISRIRSRILR